MTVASMAMETTLNPVTVDTLRRRWFITAPGPAATFRLGRLLRGAWTPGAALRALLARGAPAPPSPVLRLGATVPSSPFPASFPNLPRCCSRAHHPRQVPRCQRAAFALAVAPVLSCRASSVCFFCSEAPHSTCFVRRSIPCFEPRPPLWPRHAPLSSHHLLSVGLPHHAPAPAGCQGTYRQRPLHPGRHPVGSGGLWV